MCDVCDRHSFRVFFEDCFDEVEFFLVAFHSLRCDAEYLCISFLIITYAMHIAKYLYTIYDIVVNARHKCMANLVSES